MKTSPDCFPCLVSQALNSARMVTSDETQVRAVLRDVCLFLPTQSMDLTPSDFGREVYRIVSRITGIDDPFLALKREHTQQALSLYARLKKRVRDADDPLLTAIRVAVAGNVIDFGTTQTFDMERDLSEILTMDFAVNHYRRFRDALARAGKILYIGDNAGETVFDRVLIEEIGSPVIYAVREKPIINDALVSDAREAGLDKVAEIVSSGCDAPGCILRLCSKRFLEIFRSADLIISKGQGNYEGLSRESRPLFFLLKAKCAVVASDLGVAQGAIVLKSAEAVE